MGKIPTMRKDVNSEKDIGHEEDVSSERDINHGKDLVILTRLRAGNNTGCILCPETQESRQS